MQSAATRVVARYNRKYTTHGPAKLQEAARC